MISLWLALVSAAQCGLTLDDFHLPEDGIYYDAAWTRAMVGDGLGLGPVRDDDPELGCKLSFGAGTYTFTSTMVVSRRMILEGQGPGNTVLRFVNTSGVWVCFRGGCPAPHTEGYGAETVIRDLTIQYSGTSQTEHTGLLVEARAHGRNLHVANFPGRGIAIDADVNRSPPSGANLTSWFNVRSTGNAKDGWHFKGGDANESVLLAADASSNEGWGYNDESFLGNNYLGVHSGNNTGGALRAEGSSQRGRILLYSEVGGRDPLDPSIITNSEGKVRVSAPNLMINARIDPGTAEGDPPMVWADTSRLRLSNFQTLQTGWANYFGEPEAQVSGGIGDVDPKGAFSFVDKEGDPSGVYRLKLGSGGALNTWQLLYKGSNALSSWGVTTKDHARGAGHLIAPRGILLGSSSSAIQLQSATSTPSVQPGQREGDLAIFPGSPLQGWVFDGSVWQPFTTEVAP